MFRLSPNALNNNKPEDIVRQVRNWFVENVLKKADSGTKIWEKFNEFMADFYKKRKEEGYKKKGLEMMQCPDLFILLRISLDNIRQIFPTFAWRVTRIPLHYFRALMQSLCFNQSLECANEKRYGFST